MTDPSNALKVSYFQVFQPEPSILNYGTPPSYLDNSHLGAVGSRVHNAISNHMSAHLVLNSVQYHTLLLSVRNVFQCHKTVHIIYSQLPNINSDSATWEVMLPTCPIVAKVLLRAKRAEVQAEVWLRFFVTCQGSFPHTGGEQKKYMRKKYMEHDLNTQLW